MADVRITGTREEIDALAHWAGGSASCHRRRDGGENGYVRGVRAPRIVCLDTETTGLDPERDEVLTLSVVDWAGSTLYDGRFGTDRVREWPGAEAVNGISPASVDGLPSLAKSPELAAAAEIVGGADEVIGYNVGFDLAFLAKVGIRPREGARVTDTMRAYSERAGVWDAAHDGWKWVKLTEAAAAVGHEWTGRAHGSLADALATLSVQRWCDAHEPRAAR